MYHLFALVLLMAYMIAYIPFQADAKDFKEMSGALIAFLFA